MPIAGMPAAPTLNGNSKANLLFLSDLIGLRALNVFPKCSLVLQARWRDPRELWGRFAVSGLVLSGNPSVFGRTRAANGGMKFGRTLARTVGLSSRFKGKYARLDSWAS